MPKLTSPEKETCINMNNLETVFHISSTQIGMMKRLLKIQDFVCEEKILNKFGKLKNVKGTLPKKYLLIRKKLKPKTNRRVKRWKT